MSAGIKMLGFAGLALVAVQVFPAGRTNPPENGPLTIEDTEVADVFQRACADCHTNNTVWPWYSKVAPVSWWIVDHVEDGRSHLNLSEWDGLELDRKDHKLEEVVEVIEDGEMPLASYVRGHPEADLSDAEGAALIRWAEMQREALGGHEAGTGEGGDDQDHEEDGHQDG